MMVRGNGEQIDIMCVLQVTSGEVSACGVDVAFAPVIYTIIFSRIKLVLNVNLSVEC